MIDIQKISDEEFEEWSDKTDCITTVLAKSKTLLQIDDEKFEIYANMLEEKVFYNEKALESFYKEAFKIQKNLLTDAKLFVECMNDKEKAEHELGEFFSLFTALEIDV